MCTLVQATAVLTGLAAALVWVLAVAAYVALWRTYEGPRSRLVVGSMWLIRSGSLGAGAEPARRRVGRLLGRFVLAVLLLVAAAALATAACQPE